MTEHMVEHYECDGCGWDGMDNRGPDWGCEAYFADRPDGGRNILCRWCLEHEPMARQAAVAALPEPGEHDLLRSTVIAQATLRILRAWNEDHERRRRDMDRSREDFTNRWCASCTFRPGCDCGICEPESELKTEDLEELVEPGEWDA